MPLFSFVLLLAVGALVAVWLRRAEQSRRQKPGMGGTLEYRTPLPIDVCLDYLAHKNVNDLFLYTCTRQRDGSFWLHFTQHRPTQQMLDTVYELRLAAGRQTVVTLTFLREAFGYKEPVFPLELLDSFLAQKLRAQRVQGL